MKLLVLVATFFLPFTLQTTPCQQRETEAGAVCVCNATYCDTVPPLETFAVNDYQLFTTSKATMGFASSKGTFTNNEDTSVNVTVTVENTTMFHQEILGFGGAFTDAAVLNIAKLTEAAQRQLMESYFGKNGVQYSVGRVPIGGTDFSTKAYTYCDEKDETLEKFQLQEEDVKYKIPFVQWAIKLRGVENINFFASAWSAPIWMKNNNKFNGFGKIQEKYYDLWAKYYIKFFDAYKAENITFWGVTTQNEPVNGLIGAAVQNNGFTSSDMKNWVKNHMGPTIRNSSYNALKIILHDDQRLLLPLLNQLVLSDSDVVKYADGVGIHFYTDFYLPASFLNYASSNEKKLFRLATEACTGDLYISGLEKAVDLGSWNRADTYLNSIFEDLAYDCIGWTDWNLALDETGGPNWINNNVDAPIIINATAKEFYKQPMFYALGHFSRFVVPGSKRIGTIINGDGINSLGFVRPDGKLVVMLRNKSDSDKTVKVQVQKKWQVFTLKAHSINSLLYLA